MKISRILTTTVLATGLISGGVLIAGPATAAGLDPVHAPVEERQAALAGVDDLNESQIGFARTIIGVGRGADISDQGVKIALMTALQESSLRNLDWGDRDSLGLFQQRPSQGWGTAEQIQDPIYSSKSFYGVNPEGSNPGLLQIDGWESMTPSAAAQAVQRSAYPDAYAKWEDLAQELIDTNGDVEPIS